MFMVSEQALINWSETGSGIHITAEVTRASWEAALHKWCQVVCFAGSLCPRMKRELGQTMLLYEYLIP